MDATVRRVRSVQKGFKEPGVPAVLRYMVVLSPNFELTPNFGLTPKFGLQTSLGLVWALNMDEYSPLLVHTCRRPTPTPDEPWLSDARKMPTALRAKSENIDFTKIRDFLALLDKCASPLIAFRSRIVDV